MKILVIGAAGKSGEVLVKQALADGHEITALVHDASSYDQAGVRVIEGDVLDAAKVEAAVAGQDAVLDALGGHTPYKETTLETNAARNIIDAMRRNGVRRLVVISVLGEGDSKANAGFFYEHLLLPTFLRGTIKDKAGMESEVKSSDLDWVLVRPPFLTDGDLTGKVKVFSPEAQEKAHKISREDLAAFMLEQLTSNAHLHQAVTIATE